MCSWQWQEGTVLDHTTRQWLLPRMHLWSVVRSLPPPELKLLADAKASNDRTLKNLLDHHLLKRSFLSYNSSSFRFHVSFLQSS